MPGTSASSVKFLTILQRHYEVSVPKHFLFRALTFHGWILFGFRFYLIWFRRVHLISYKFHEHEILSVFYCAEMRCHCFMSMSCLWQQFVLCDFTKVNQPLADIYTNQIPEHCAFEFVKQTVIAHFTSS